MKRRLTMLALLLATTISTAGSVPFRAASLTRLRRAAERSANGSTRQLAGGRESARQPAGSRRIHARPAASPGRRRRSPARRTAPARYRPPGDHRPLDGRKRDLGFLLDSRLDADGVLVLHNGRILSERYRNGLRAGEPRLLLQATRPLLAAFGRDEYRPGQTHGRQGRHPFRPGPEQPVGLAQAVGSAPAAGPGTACLVTEELAQWRQAGAGQAVSRRQASVRGSLSPAAGTSHWSSRKFPRSPAARTTTCWPGCWPRVTPSRWPVCSASSC
jgi:hypothetical protein